MKKKNSENCQNRTQQKNRFKAFFTDDIYEKGTKG